MAIVLSLGLSAQDNPTFSQRVSAIIARPKYKNATFGLEIYSLDAEKPLFTLNAGQLFTPGSTTKLLTEGTAMELLGSVFHAGFHGSLP